jgi:predicted DNA-binding protein with PD1-like motif
MNMMHRIEGNLIFAKLDKGEDVFSSIERLIEIYGIKGGTVLSGIGMLREFEIGYFNGKEYEKKFVEKNHELVALHGSISQDEPRLHLHAGLAGPDHMIIGGHLFRGKVDPLLELTIAVTSFPMKRVYNEKTNLKELSL